MNTRHSLWLAPLASLAAVACPAQAASYPSIEQAQSAMFPRAAFVPSPHTLTSSQIAAIEKASGERVLSPQLRAWRVSTGGWFIIDEVVGKHEFITYAVGLDAAGAVKGVEILDYRESYGGEVSGAAWRAQFIGKRSGAPLTLGVDIRNISGATLSSKHLTGGIKRLLATYAVVLLPSA